MKRIVLFSQAINDLEFAFDYYFDVANLQIAERFREAVGQALGHIQLHPATGSKRYALADVQPPPCFILNAIRLSTLFGFCTSLQTFPLT